MSDERGAEITSDVPIIHYCDRWIVFGRQDAGGGPKRLSDFTSDFVKYGCALLGIVAASARREAL